MARINLTGVAIGIQHLPTAGVGCAGSGRRKDVLELARKASWQSRRVATGFPLRLGPHHFRRHGQTRRATADTLFLFVDFFVF